MNILYEIRRHGLIGTLRYTWDKITSLIIYGRSVLIRNPSYIVIIDHNHGSYADGTQSDPGQAPVLRDCVSKCIVIRRNVWIGENVCVLPGVEIGEGSVIGAGSVVTKSIPAGVVAVGNPAKIVRYWNGKCWVANEKI